MREYLEAVRTAVDEGDYDVVFSSDDIGVIALSRHRDGLGAVVPYAGHDTVMRSLDKLRMTRAAEAVGLAVPRTAQATDDAIERLDAPAIVKPRLHSVLRPGAPGRLETVLARSPEEARDAVAEIREAGVEPILQEVVQGDLMSFQAVIDRDGTDAGAGPAALPAHLAARLRVGGTRSHTVAIDPVLAAQVAAFFQRLGWFGLAQLQFIAPHDGGEPRLIDLNGRYYSSLALAVASGPNLPGIWARLATGRPVESIPPSEPGHSYQWFSRDLRASWRAEGLRGAAGTMRISAGSVHSVWCHDDPWPSFHHYSTQLAASGGRRLHAVVHFLAALGAGSSLV